MIQADRQPALLAFNHIHHGKELALLQSDATQESFVSLLNPSIIAEAAAFR
ncbi:MAG: hypothetical protein GX087_07555 [Desulfobulbaceae bacterium]|nr:hypothetical protein [Desulfobulbaceae bacterium]